MAPSDRAWQSRDHPLPEALRRPGNLGVPAPTAPSCAGSVTSRLTTIGASTPSPNSFGDLATIAHNSMVDLVAGRSVLTREGIRKTTASMRAELAGPSASPLERLLVDRVLACCRPTSHITQPEETVNERIRAPLAPPGSRRQAIPVLATQPGGAAPTACTSRSVRWGSRVPSRSRCRALGRYSTNSSPDPRRHGRLST